MLDIVITFGLVFFEINDAIKEGDGERMFGAYKLALLIYKSDGYNKYAYNVLLYLVHVIALLPGSEACDLKWNRFHNKYGGQGNNTPLDLTKEQQNKVLKTMWKALGSNLTHESATRVAKTLDYVEAMMSSTDADCE